MLKRFTLPSPVGALTIIMQDDHICICEFADQSERIKQHLAKHYDCEMINDAKPDPTISQAFQQYFSGDPTALDKLKVAPRGTPFQQDIWRALRDIPAGKTWSYAKLAEKVRSHPRAVGGANGSNPVALIIPCHRVIGKDGSLTGYAGGLPRKKWLLTLETAL